ncbi:MAG TPA: hypothetical protein VL380_05830, partial [Nitrosospira sp.]|nr:hypothetical protein [Nitrosospira sp.]
MAVFNFKFVNRPRPLGAPLGDRSASNLELPHVPGGELVQLARHHMISWYQIKRCWNFLILPNIQTSNFVELREAIRNYVEFVVDDALKWDGISPITVRNATAALERLLNNIDMHSDAAGIPQAPDMPEIARIFCWNPRNIFLGPAGDGHRNYSDWITMGSGQGAPRWKRADPGHQFEEYATHIINRRGSGHFYNLREISEKIDLQMNSDNASEQDLVAFIKTMVDPAIEPVRLDVRHADWFRMNGFFE